MSKCDACLNHAKERHKIRGGDVLYILNLTETQLKKMTIDDLLEVYKMAKNGISVCENCLQLCEEGHEDCTINHIANKGAYGFRIKEDRHVIDQIRKETTRRENVEKVMSQIRR